MSENDFNFLNYLDSIEKIMLDWYDHTREILKHPPNLGGIREHFIKDVLEKFLPTSVLIGSGEITDGKNRSRQQDIIIYQSNFPVIKGFDTVNLYLIEGVIATIEVKSDLSSGNPNGLMKAFENLATISSLYNQALIIDGTQKKIKDLQRIYSAKTYVIGYKGWRKKDSLLENFRKAGNKVKWNVPDIVYQPEICIVKNTPTSGLTYKNQKENSLPMYAICEEHPLAVFFQILFRTILTRVSLIATEPNNKAKMQFHLNSYFSLPLIPCTSILFSDRITNLAPASPKKH